MNNDLTTMLIAFLAAANCGLIGSFLMLKGQAMVGDAISHAILPGVVIAFLLGNSLHPLLLAMGAIGAGVLAALSISCLNKYVKVPNGTAIGITLSCFFALGVTLLAMFAQQVDLDLSCIWYGNLISAHFDRFIWQGIDRGPRAIFLLGFLLFVNGLLLYLCYPALVITSFDPNFAASLGMRTKRWDAAFTVLTTVNTVFVFRIVGLPLVIGFFIVPSATAFLFSKQLGEMIFYTLILAMIMTFHSYQIALCLNTSLVGAMITVGGGCFALFFFIHTRSKTIHAT